MAPVQPCHDAHRCCDPHYQALVSHDQGEHDYELLCQCWALALHDSDERVWREQQSRRCMLLNVCCVTELDMVQ